MAKKNNELPELVFIPVPGMGHLLPMVETAQRTMARHSDKISIVISIIKYHFPEEKLDSFINSFKSSNMNNITLLEIPPPTDNIPDPSSMSFLSQYMDAYAPNIIQALLDRYRRRVSSSESSSSSPRLAGLVLDLFCSGMVDLFKNELGVPSYIFFTSCALFLSFMLRLESLRVDIPAVYGQSPDETVTVQGFENPIPVKVWPTFSLDSQGGAEMLVRLARGFRRSKGIMVNTFMELEPSVIQSLQSNDCICIPPIYPIGPILNLPNESESESESNNTSSSNSSQKIMNWLDSQPPSSVVFLCFGSRGCFPDDQVREIAAGLERSGQRFLWSLRSQPKRNGNNDNNNNNKSLKLPDEYQDLKEVLPEGFLDRIALAGKGKVIGWAPQVTVLAHKSVGAFVSHCGWNSTLESLWFGVPMLAWPVYAEQQLNAFALVKEMGLAVEIKNEFRCDLRVQDGGANMLVKAEEVETAVRMMMEEEQGKKVRNRVKQMSHWAKKAVLEDDGSSNKSMARFVDDISSSYI